MDNTKKKSKRVMKKVVVRSVNTSEGGATTDVRSINVPAVKAVESSSTQLSEATETSSTQAKPAAVRKHFTELQEDLIIDFYSRNRFLWDSTHENYKIAIKSASLQELVVQLDNKFTAQEIHHRFSGMRTTYKNNMAKVKKSMSTGASADDVYEPTWPHFDRMKFLDDSTPNRASISSYITQQLNAENFEILDLTADAVEDSCAPPTAKLGPALPKTKNLPSAKNKQNEVINECLQVLRSVQSTDSVPNDVPKDRCECYGVFVSASLKAMSQWNQTLAMSDITNVLLKYDPNNPQNK